MKGSLFLTIILNKMNTKEVVFFDKEGIKGILKNNRFYFSYEGRIALGKDEDVKRMFLEALELMRENKVDYMVNDILKLEGPITQLIPFFQEVIPDMVSLGMKRNGIVMKMVGGDAFTNFGVVKKLKPVLEEIGLAVQTFSNTFSAEAWFKEILR